ncbi:hypothetical protein ACAW74_05320 [Fibrella sp. WM1]|uniref:hypothetical protein n=1 Tax=Fibrella musci TaxID=3242485 RepID=UPI0035226E88
MNWRRRYRYTFIGLFWTVALSAQPSQTLSGRVLGYMANRIGDYDGLQLRTNAGVLWVRFPPHAAAQVLKLAPVGQAVSATVIRSPHPPGPPPPTGGVQGFADAGYQLVSLQQQARKTGFQLADVPPPLPTRGRLIQAEEPLTGQLRDEAGRLVALLTTRFVVELKPHQGESIRELLEGVSRLELTGYERTEPGFVNKTGRTLLHPTTLTINGQTFAL